MNARSEDALRLQQAEALGTAAVDAGGETAAVAGRDQPYSTRYVWYVVLLLTVVNVFNYMDRMALSVMLPYIKADLVLSDAQLGMLVGLAFALFYAICGIPIAMWADRGVRRNIIALALATWSLMTAISGAAQNFWHLFVARVGVGVGEAGCLPPAQSLLCDYVPLERRSGVFAVHTSGLVIGMMLGLALAGWLGETIGWRWTFVALGIPGLAVAILVRLTLREPQCGFFDAAQSDRTDSSLCGAAVFLWRCRTYRYLTYFGVANGFLQYGLSQWWPSFYSRIFELGSSAIGLYLGVGMGVGSGLGVLLGGLVSNKVAQRDIRLPLMAGAAAVGCTLSTVLGALFVPSPTVSLVLVSLSALLWSVPSGPLIAAIYSVVMPRIRATAGSISVFITSVFGFALGPLCVGLLSDALTPSYGAEGLRYALLAPLGVLPLMVITLFVAARALPNDLKAVGARA